MQKIFFLILALLAMRPMHCVEETETTAVLAAEPAQQETEAAESSSAEGAHPQTGAASASSAQASQKWQNWVFAGSALVTVTVGVVIISLNSGTTSH